MATRQGQVEVALQVVECLWSARTLPGDHFTGDCRFLLHGRAISRAEFERLSQHALSRAMPDASVRVRRTLHEGDAVAVRATTSGTHTGELFGVPATGRTVSFNCIAWFNFAGLQVRELHIHWNGLALVRPLWDAYDRLTRDADVAGIRQ
jgi:predicted ester cyclase